MDAGSLLLSLYQRPLTNMRVTPQLEQTLQRPFPSQAANLNPPPAAPFSPPEPGSIADLQNQIQVYQNVLRNPGNQPPAYRWSNDQLNARIADLRAQIAGLAPRPITPPSGPLVRGGGLMGREENIQRQRESLEPPND